MHESVASCLEGALLAAAALEIQGKPPIVLNLKAVRDDDHVVVPFRHRGLYGAVAKSNFSGLRYRSPVYRTLRELVISYFEHHYNVAGELTLRAYSRPLTLSQSRFPQWQILDERFGEICDALDLSPHTKVVPKALETKLRRVDRRLFLAGLLGANEKGLYAMGEGEA
jgi:hypothetical protein